MEWSPPPLDQTFSKIFKYICEDRVRLESFKSVYSEFCSGSIDTQYATLMICDIIRERPDLVLEFLNLSDKYSIFEQSISSRPYSTDQFTKDCPPKFAPLFTKLLIFFFFGIISPGYLYDLLNRLASTAGVSVKELIALLKDAPSDSIIGMSQEFVKIPAVIHLMPPNVETLMSIQMPPTLRLMALASVSIDISQIDSCLEALRLFSLDLISPQTTSTWLSAFSPVFSEFFYNLYLTIPPSSFDPARILCSAKSILEKQMAEWVLGEQIVNALLKLEKKSPLTPIQICTQSRFTAGFNAISKSKIDILEMQTIKLFQIASLCTSYIKSGSVPDVGTLKSALEVFYGSIPNRNLNVEFISRLLSRVKSAGREAQRKLSMELEKKMAELSPSSFDWRILKVGQLRRHYLLREVFFCGKVLQIPGETELSYGRSELEKIFIGSEDLKQKLVQMVNVFEWKEFTLTDEGCNSLIYFCEFLAALGTSKCQGILQIISAEKPPFRIFGDTPMAHLDAFIVKLAKELKRCQKLSFVKGFCLEGIKAECMGFATGKIDGRVLKIDFHVNPRFIVKQ